MKLLHRYRGGGYIGKDNILGWGVLDLSTLELYEDRLILRTWPIRIEVPYNKIDSIEEGLMSSFFPWLLKKKKSLKINHHANSPSYLIFWEWFGNHYNKEILDFFRQRGINIIENIDNPMTIREIVRFYARLGLIGLSVGFIFSIILITFFVLINSF